MASPAFKGFPMIVGQIENGQKRRIILICERCGVMEYARGEEIHLCVGCSIKEERRRGRSDVQGNEVNRALTSH